MKTTIFKPKYKFKKGNLYSFEYPGSKPVIFLLSDVEKFFTDYLVFSWVNVSAQGPVETSIVFLLDLEYYMKWFSPYVDSGKEEKTK